MPVRENERRHSPAECSGTEKRVGLEDVRYRPAEAADFAFLATMLGEAAVWRPEKPTPSGDDVLANPRYGRRRHRPRPPQRGPAPLRSQTSSRATSAADAPPAHAVAPPPHFAQP